MTQSGNYLVAILKVTFLLPVAKPKNSELRRICSRGVVCSIGNLIRFTSFSCTFCQMGCAHLKQVQVGAEQQRQLAKNNFHIGH